MRYICKVITLCLFVFACLVAMAQAFASVQNLSLKQLSVADGLSQGSVYTLMQDKQGHIWVGTEAGVNIYDGYTVRHLSGPDGDFSQYAVENLYQDSSGIVWINLYEKGLVTYDPIRGQYQEVLQADPNDDDNYIVDIVEKSADEFLIATAKTIGRYHRGQQKFETLLDLSGELVGANIINQILMDDDILYIATRIGIYAFDINNNIWKKLPTYRVGKQFSQVEADKVFNLYLYKNKQLFIGTNVAIFKANISNIKSFILGRATLPPIELLLENISSWDFAAKGDELYIGNDRGLAVLNMKTGESKHLFGLSEVEKHVGGDQIVSVLEDNQGQFWLGSNATGAYRWNPSADVFTNIKFIKDSPNSLSHNEVWHIQPNTLNKQRAWVATTNGLNSIDIKTGEVTQYLVNAESNSFYNESHIYLIREDNQQRLWLSTAKGIVLFDIKTKKQIPLPFSDEINKKLIDKDIVDIFIDRDQVLWLSAEDGITTLSLDSGEIDLLPELNQIVPKNSMAYTLGYLPDSETLAIATYGTLLGYNPEKRSTKLIYQMPGIIDTQMILADGWAIDKNNIFWLNFSGAGIVGLTLPDFEQKYFFNKNNSIVDNNTYGVMADSEGDIWFSSHHGLYLLDADNLHIRNFTLEDGLPAMEFNAGAHNGTINSKLAYGSMSGVTIFDPLVTKKNQRQRGLNVFVTHVDVLSRHLNLPMVVTEKTPISFNYDDIGIRFSFSTLTYGNHKLIEYEYILTGEQEVRYPLTVKNDITFANLSSGNYQLTVRAKSPITGQYSQPTKLHFSVSYAPWASPMAYFVYAVIVILLVTYWLNKKAAQTQKLKDAHEQVKFRENRLQLALAGSNSEVWDWKANDELMFGNRIARELGYSDKGSSYHFSEHLALIHPNDRMTFLSHWQSYLEYANQQDNFSCTYRMKSSEGKWLWYQDLGKAVSFKNGKPSRITGSYTNITESRAAEQRAQYYGDAFKQTNDWVLIVSENFANMTANQSLREVFGWQDEELRFDSSLLGLSRERRNYYRQVFLSLKEGDHWRGEDLVLTKEGTEYHVIININACRNNTNNSIYYVCVFTDITAQKLAENELRYLANYDHLNRITKQSIVARPY